MADYAKELLAPKPATNAGTDYASDILAAPKPATKSLSDITVTPSEGASFATLSKAAMVDDPTTKLKIFAADRFPNDPKAHERYGIMNGEVIYAGQDGKIYQETPTGFLGGIKGFAANLVGKSPTIGGGIVGAVSAAPGGPIASIVGAGAGAIGGEGWRKTVANLALNEPQTVEGNIKSMGKEGAFAGSGEILGAGLTGALERNLARDFGRLNPAKVADLESKAGAIGVDLFPAQTTNLRSLKGRHEALARMDASSDIVSDAATKQAEQANRAGYDFFGNLSNKSGDAGAMGQKAAQDILKARSEARAEDAAPIYEKAFAVPVETPPALAALITRPSMADAVKLAKKYAAEQGMDLADPTNTMRGLHYVKMGLDEVINNAPQTSAGNTYARLASDTRDKLLGFMDNASSDYKKARQVYEGHSNELDQVENGLVGKLANKQQQLDAGARNLFSPNQDPAAVRYARKEFEKQGKSDEWDGLVRNYLQDAFEQAGKYEDGITSQAPRFRKEMIGNPRQREILQNALTYDQYQALMDMSDVFEAIGRVKVSGNSMTMPLQESAKALRSESEGLTGKALAPLQSLKDWVTEARLGNHAEQMAKILTTPGDLKRLKQLRNVSDNDQKLINGASAFFGLSVSPAGAGEVQGQQLDQRLRQ
jgi:hypothetical protein